MQTILGDSSDTFPTTLDDPDTIDSNKNAAVHEQNHIQGENGGADSPFAWSNLIIDVGYYGDQDPYGNNATVMQIAGSSWWNPAAGQAQPPITGLTLLSKAYVYGALPSTPSTTSEHYLPAFNTATNGTMFNSFANQFLMMRGNTSVLVSQPATFIIQNLSYALFRKTSPIYLAPEGSGYGSWWTGIARVGLIFLVIILTFLVANPAITS